MKINLQKSVIKPAVNDKQKDLIVNDVIEVDK